MLNLLYTPYTLLEVNGIKVYIVKIDDVRINMHGYDRCVMVDEMQVSLNKWNSKKYTAHFVSKLTESENYLNQITSHKWTFDVDGEPRFLLVTL